MKPSLDAGRGIEYRTVWGGRQVVPVTRQLARDGVTLLADAPDTDEYWFDGYEDLMYAEKLSGIFRRHAERRGLPVQGTPQYSREPWGGMAVRSPHNWIEEQKEIAATKPFRPLAILEHGDPANNVVPLRG